MDESFTNPNYNLGANSAMSAGAHDEPNDEIIDPSMLQTSSATMVGGLQTPASAYDVPLNYATMNDDYSLPMNNWGGIDPNLGQDFQMSNVFVGNNNMLGQNSFPNQSLGHENTMCDNFYIDPRYSMPTLDGITVQPQAAYITPPVLSPNFIPEQNETTMQPLTQDINRRGARQPAWGVRRPDGRSPTDSNVPTKRKSKDISANPETSRRRSITSAQSSTKGNTQTMPSKAKKGESKDRAAHNMIEKQYRKRLNGQFETLLRALPPDSKTHDTEDENSDTVSSEGKVSKGEVLVQARRYIRELEKEGKSLMENNEQLKAKQEEVEEAWVRMGGTPMP